MTALTGYFLEDSLAAGEKAELAVDSQGRPFEARLVRLLGPADDFQPDAAWFSSAPAGDVVGHPGAEQRTTAGSYAATGRVELPERIAFATWLWPTLPAAGRPAVVFSANGSAGAGVALLLDGEGRPRIRVTPVEGDVVEVVAPTPLVARRWASIALSVDMAAGRIELAVVAGGAFERVRGEFSPLAAVDRGVGSFALGAELAPDGARHHFDGKLDRPRLWFAAAGEGEVAQLAQDEGDPLGTPAADWSIDSVEAAAHPPFAIGTGPLALTIVNRGQPGVTGRTWSGAVLDYRLDPAQYTAIRFHSDDLADAGWTTSLVLDLPVDLPSGVYAAELSIGDERAWIPLYVRPAAGRSRNDVLYLAPTMTYLAYGNDRQHTHAEFGDMTGGNPLRDYEHWINAHPEVGSSIYDFHPDGDGCSFSARRRPLGNVRPDYVSWITGTPRHFSADLAVVGWLDDTGVGFDVATDHDLDRLGAELLGRYRVVVTGSHPEYVSGAMLDALEGYLADGGKLMYLGGNGYYWVTGVTEDGSIEVRRGHAGTRMWESAPGEDLLAVSAEPGGLWRHRGRTPNRLVGIGFAAQGWAGNRPYTVAEDLPAGLHELVFGSIAPGAVIGADGRFGGAAGDEVDRWDPALGSPPEAVVLARSQRFTDAYQPAVEDQLTVTPGIGGAENPRVRSDIVYWPRAGGGAVFAVGSISWALSLPLSGYRGDVAEICTNVLRGLLAGRL